MIAMKKTLAAVLAAAMALSTASVAFATDFDIDGANLVEGDINDGKWEILYGKDVKLLVNDLTLEDIGDVSGSELAQKIDDGEIEVSVVVTEGSSKFAAKPSVETGVNKEGNGNYDREVKYLVAAGLANATVGGVTFGAVGSEITKIPVGADGKYTNVEANIVGYVTKNSTGWTTAAEDLVTNWQAATKDYTFVENHDDTLRIKFKVADTYGTSDTTVGFKLRVRIKKSDVTLGGVSVGKGNTYTSDEITFKAVYKELSQYDEDMQLTLTEVDDRLVKLDASDLYDEIGTDTFTIYFDDIAAFSAKLSSAQKDVNLFYIVDDIADIADAYPDVDFEMITFKGAPSFTNSGSMTFNAIGGRDTTVYTFDGETLTPLTTTYDSTYGTVTAKGIKKLGTFVVASEVLEVEEEKEPEEPADETPAVEEQNPQTGAC